MNETRIELLGIASEAVAIGCNLLTSIAPGEIKEKGDRDYVTDLDIRIQNEIREYLARSTPSAEFIGEESLSTETPKLGPDSDEVWILDPIDGTSNFIHGVPLVAISLAFVSKGAPVIAIISTPLLSLEYKALAGGGSFINGKKLHASEVKSLDKAIVSIGDYAVGKHAKHKNERRLATTAALAANVERVRMFGSAAIDLAWVAEGRTDACVVLTNKPWDMAAGVLIAREAGAVVTDSGGQPYNFQSSDVVAAAPSISDKLLTLVVPA